MDLDYFLLLVLKPGLEVYAACTIPSSRALDVDSEMMDDIFNGSLPFGGTVESDLCGLFFSQPRHGLIM